VYLASESDAPTYFDNLSVSHQQGMIVQEHHYDPFGLHLTGIEKEGSYPYQYNGLSEQQADPTGKGYSYETDWRGYDPQLGRFKGIDALADEMPGINPYQYAFNNPLNFNDPSGLYVLPVVTVVAKRILASTAAQVFGQAVMHSAVQFTAGAAIQALGGGASGCCPGPCCPEQGAQQAQTSRQTPATQQGVAQEARGVNPLTLPVAEQVVERVVGQAVGRGAAWLVRGASAFVAAMLYPHPAGAGSAFTNQLVGEQLQRFNELEAVRTTGNRSLTPSELEELDLLTQLQFPHGRPSRVSLPNLAGKGGFKTLSELGLKDGMKVSSSRALELGEQFLGKGYKELVPGSGRYVSADGKRVFRMGISDITGAHGGGPHVNFETLIPNPAKAGKMMVDKNVHIYLTHLLSYDGNKIRCTSVYNRKRN
jgi:RHS repeat-associated protein